MLSMTLLARSEFRPGVERETRPAGLLPTFAIATGLAYVQSLLGGIVSTSHAGLACPDWPACDGRWFPPLASPEGLQMLHRYGAYALTAAVMLVAIRSRTAPDSGVRRGGSLAFGLTLAQVVIGVGNVLGGTPAWLSAVHLANAAAILATLVATTFRVARMPAESAQVALATSP
jgi:heme a synthase